MYICIYIYYLFWFGLVTPAPIQGQGSGEQQCRPTGWEQTATHWGRESADAHQRTRAALPYRTGAWDASKVRTDCTMLESNTHGYGLTMFSCCRRVRF